MPGGVRGQGRRLPFLLDCLHLKLQLLARNRGNACFGNLHILVGFYAGNAHGTYHMTVNSNRHAT